MIKKIQQQKGMALVVALLTSLILLALVTSLFFVISSTSRQVEYAKNSAIALNLAEAGTADAIYRLNYCTGIADNYPFVGSAIPFGITASDTVLVTGLTELPAVSAPGQYATLGIKGNLGNGYYAVGLIDADPSDDTKADTIVAVGVSKGIRRILTVSLRGVNDTGSARQASTQGISEAFNKHVIYAGTVIYNTAATVNGNITSINADTLPAITTTIGATKTKVANIDNTFFPVIDTTTYIPPDLGPGPGAWAPPPPPQ